MRALSGFIFMIPYTQYTRVHSRYVHARCWQRPRLNRSPAPPSTWRTNRAHLEYHLFSLATVISGQPACNMPPSILNSPFGLPRLQL